VAGLAGWQDAISRFQAAVAAVEVAALSAPPGNAVRSTAHPEQMTVVGYRAWLVRHLGMAFVSLILVIVGQHAALIYTRAEHAPFSSQRDIPTLSEQYADVRLVSPGGGATSREQPDSREVPFASAAPGGGDGDRWSAMLRPPFS
jgi:hypothetical protein